jgi:hypothetical protein
MHGPMNVKNTCRVLYQNKLEKQCMLLAFVVRIYYYARSSECPKNVKLVLKLNASSQYGMERDTFISTEV